MGGAEPGEPIVVSEYGESDPVALSAAERDALRGLSSRIAVRPVEGSDGLYRLSPGGLVGAIQVGRTRFELRPKLAVRRLLFMLGYSMDPGNWRRQGFDFEQEDDLFEAIVPGFAFQVEEALRHGPLQGYRAEEAALQTVRGRIRFADQVRTRFGLIPPIECVYDEFSDDIEINRLLKAAIARLGAIRLRSETSRRRLRALAPCFANVTPVAYDPRNLPEVRFDRRSEHYRGPVELARLILRTGSIGSRSGGVAGAAFLLNMATVFEDFVVTALREALGLGEAEFPQGAKGHALHLDLARTLRLKPDLSWWSGEHCHFVGDVKYKLTPEVSGVLHPDMYQLLAYTTAAKRPRGLLVYAAGERPEGVHQIPPAAKQITVRTLNLDTDPDTLLAQITQLAGLVREQAADPADTRQVPVPPTLA